LIFKYVTFRALIAGIATLLGGILGGKKGLVVGGLVGGISAAAVLKGMLFLFNLTLLIN
jgi:hypothetical protein